MLKPKVSIIGGGNVGIRYAFSLMLSGLARSLVIIDSDKRRAEGEVMDLASGMPYLSPVEIKAGEYPDLADSDLIVITAGKKQIAGQTRMDLARENTEIFKVIIPQIMRYAKEALLLIVTNPVDVLSYAAFKLSGKPWQQVIGSGTVLDSSRLRLFLSQHCDIDARNIHGYILGEHGDSEFPVWSKAMFGASLLSEHCSSCQKCNNRQELEKIFAQVRDFAYRVIERKGETSYGIGLALVKITEAILKDENSVLPVSCFITDYYGVKGIYLSMPAVVNKSGVREVLSIQLDEQEIAYFKASAQKVKEAISELKL